MAIGCWGLIIGGVLWGWWENRQWDRDEQRAADELAHLEREEELVRAATDLRTLADELRDEIQEAEAEAAEWGQIADLELAYNAPTAKPRGW